MNTSETILAGVNKLANTVKQTLGTKGRTILFNDENNRTHITKDGVTVARHIMSEDNYENLVITVLREASLKTMKSSGDGPQPLWAKVLTPNGFTTMGEIKVGDKVCGVDGTTQSVLGTFDKGEKEIYKVHFSDKRVVECCEDHLWGVTYTLCNKPEYKTMTTKELIDSKKITVNKHGFKTYGFYTPHSIVEFEKPANLKIDPYLLGVLLGDGCLKNSGSIEISLGPNKKHILDKLILPEGCSLGIKWVENKNYYRVKITGEGAVAFRVLLNDLGLADTGSSTKFIPHEYLYTDSITRTQLLQGLLDTDGYMNKRGLFEFSTISDRLKDDFLTLVRSLGYFTNYVLRNRDSDKNSYSNTSIHRIVQLRGYKYGDKIVKIEATGEFTEMKCIKVSNPDSLYITDNFIVTHNTTTTMILAQYLITEGLKLLSEGVSFYELSKQIDHAVKDIVDYINNNSIKIEDNPELLREIAAISSNDEKLGDFIYSIVEDIGLYGDIEVKESQYSETRIHKTQGMKLHKGWIETFMVNDVREMSFKADNCHVLIIDDTIQAVTDIDKYIHALAGKPLVVFCDDITDITLKQIEKMIQAIGPKICFVNNDGHGDRKLLLMNDLAALTSAYVIDAKSPFDIKNMGFAEKIKVDEWYTSIIGGKGDTELIEQLVEEIKDTLEDDENVDETNLTHVERKFHKKRLANLTGGVAVIHVGGKTQMEMKELKDRFDDAVLAVESAIKQGVNVGGGSTYINCQKSLNKAFKEQWGRGYKMVLGSLESPFKQLLINADLFNQFEYFKDSLIKGMALDLRDNKLYKLSEAKYKVYDPSSVLIDSLVNASAVAKSLLSIKDILYDGKKLDK